MAEDGPEARAIERRGRVLPGGLNQLHTPVDVGGDDVVSRAFEHGGRGVHDSDVVALAGERDALMAGSASHVHDLQRR